MEPRLENLRFPPRFRRLAGRDVFAEGRRIHEDGRVVDLEDCGERVAATVL